jgi:hypothetical protein
VSNESLWNELREREEQEDARYKQNLAMKEVAKVKPKPVDYNAAMKRFNDEIKPVIERREKARTSKAYRLFLKVTGQWTDLDAAEAISPTKGLVSAGQTPEELAHEIQQNPDAFKHLSKTAPKITPVAADHRIISPKVGGPRDDS